MRLAATTLLCCTRWCAQDQVHTLLRSRLETSTLDEPSTRQFEEWMMLKSMTQMGARPPRGFASATGMMWKVDQKRRLSASVDKM